MILFFFLLLYDFEFENEDIKQTWNLKLAAHTQCIKWYGMNIIDKSSIFHLNSVRNE